MTIPLITDHAEGPGMTFAEPGATRGAAETSFDWFGATTAATPVLLGARLGMEFGRDPKAYAALFTASERTQRLTGNIASESAAREEAYDARIAAVRKATGLELENPERGGYQTDARQSIRDEMRAGMPNGPIEGGIYARARQMFDDKLAEAQQAHPELQFGSVDDDARQIAHGAATAPAPPDTKDPLAGLAASFAGGIWGSRRDPIFLGSLLAGPAAGAGRTALARVAQSALRSGLYNAGISAVEQPAVQDWRARVGIEHGVTPAMEDIGLAFLMGAIPGAVIHGFAEGARAPLQRTLAGHPLPGDQATLRENLAAIPLRDAAGLRAGEDSVAADQATITIPKPKDVPADLHDDMMAAALRRADQPDAPAPEAVAAVHAVGEANRPGLTLQRVGERAENAGATRFDIADEGGAKIGVVDVKPSDDGRTLNIGWIGDEEASKLLDIGPARVRGLLRQLQAEYPDAERVTGIRATGARGDEMKMASVALKPIDAEIADRLKAAEPKTPAEAAAVADEALDDIGRAHGMAALRDRMGAADAERVPAPKAAEPPSETAVQPRPRGDVMDKVPWVDDKGRPDVFTPASLAKVGLKESELSMLVRSCK